MTLWWSPRILGILVSGFVAIFALDAVGRGEFLVHLIPSILLLGLVVAAWRRPWIGAFGFIALAVGYAVAAHRHLDWIMAISGPLLVVGTLFALSSRR
jgi:hypothetical protein